MKYKIARARFWLNRFQDLPRSERIFSDADPDTLLERPLFGFTFVCNVSREAPQRLLYLEGERFVAERRLIRSLLRPGFRVVDVGANIGYYVLMLAQRIGPHGSIVAIEPSPENLRELRLNVDRNSLNDRVEIVEAAVGDEDAIVGLKGGINSGVVQDGSGSYDVRICRLDDIIENKVDFIKMDIEGHEYFAISGAARILRLYHPILFIEIHPAELKAQGRSAESLIALLKDVYVNIKIFRQPAGTGIIRKFTSRYFGRDSIDRVDDVSDFIQTVDAVGERTPFWAVCH